MDLDRARYLVSSEGRSALEDLPGDLASLSPTALADRLRRAHPPAQASALAEQVTLRGRAREKLGDAAGSWLLTPDGLEMMTHPLVASRRARRLAALGIPVLDLTCGLGGDLRAVIEAGARGAGFDHDAAVALLASANVPGAGVGRADAAHPPARPGAAAVVIDPSRRGRAGRTFDPAAFSPRWDVAVELARGAAAAVIKAPPGIDHAALPREAEVEFVQVGRVLRECASWLGAGAVPGARRAVLLPGEYVLDSRGPEGSPAPAPPGRFVMDPRSCVTRAGLVRQLAARLGAWMLDPSIAYLSADEPSADPLCECFAVLEVLPFSVQRIRRRLRETHRSPVEIRRRGFPVEPDDLRRRLGRLDGDPVSLLCTTLLGERVVVVGRRVS